MIKNGQLSIRQYWDVVYEPNYRKKENDFMGDVMDLLRTTPDGQGVIAAVGWSGQWQALLERDAIDGRLRMRAGLERLHTILHPDEAIRSPRILLVFWTGERVHGQNLLRRVLLEHYTPRRGNQPIVGPIWART